jgi:Effector Associated Constant Component 1
MTDASLTLNLSADIPDARLAQLTHDLERDLSRAGIGARPLEALSVPGQRGEPITLGVLVLALVTSGAVKAMIECVKAYLSRERALTIKFAREDGTQVEVTAQNVDAPAVREALEAMASTRSR